MKTPEEMRANRYRTCIYNDSSWGRWVTAGEFRTRAEAESCAARYRAKYDTSIERINRTHLIGD